MDQRIQTCQVFHISWTHVFADLVWRCLGPFWHLANVSRRNKQTVVVVDVVTNEGPP